MGRRRVEFQWQVDEVEWEGGTPPVEERVGTSTENQIAPSHSPRLLLHSLALMLVLVVLTASAAHSQERLAYLATYAGVQSALFLESQAVKAGDQGKYYALAENPTKLAELQGWLNPWRMRSLTRGDLDLDLVGVEAEDDLAVVVVRVTPPTAYWVPVPYRETRFYHRQGDVWLRTTPSADFWGELRLIENDRWQIEYFERDAGAVDGVLERLEAMLPTIYETLALTPPVESRITFAVEPRVAGGWASSGERLAVTSPTLIRLPEQASPSDRLTDTMLDHLVNRALSQALHISELYHAQEWYITLLGVQSWLRGDVLQRPVYWRIQGEQTLRERAASYFPFRLSDVTRQARIAPEDRLLRAMLAETVIAHVTERYGRDGLALLLQGMREYESWEELIPAVFGDSVERFTAEWNLYLSQRYGLAQTVDEGQ